nr:immunoglobulin heavy chain junction region [Mus musculus]
CARVTPSYYSNYDDYW